MSDKKDSIKAKVLNIKPKNCPTEPKTVDNNDEPSTHAKLQITLEQPGALAAVVVEDEFEPGSPLKSAKKPEVKCFVTGCKYPSTHTTKGHLCGVCLKNYNKINYGHGGYDHSALNPKKCEFKQTSLEKSHMEDNILENDRDCDCAFNHCHFKAGHFCDACQQFGHNVVACPLLK